MVMGWEGSLRGGASSIPKEVEYILEKDNWLCMLPF